MNNENKEKFKIIANLAQTYNRELSEGAIEMILGALDDVSVEYLKEAIKRLIKDADYMPTVADIRDKVFSELDNTVHIPGLIYDPEPFTQEEKDQYRKDHL